MANVKDMLFDNKRDFALYFYKHDSAKTRKAVLTTFKLQVWYCLLICVRKEVYVDMLSNYFSRIRDAGRTRILITSNTTIKDMIRVMHWFESSVCHRPVYSEDSDGWGISDVNLAHEWEGMKMEVGNG